MEGLPDDHDHDHDYHVLKGVPDDHELDVLEGLPDDDDVLEGLPRPRCEAWICRSQDGGQPEDGCGKPIIVIPLSSSLSSPSSPSSSSLS